MSAVFAFLALVIVMLAALFIVEPLVSGAKKRHWERESTDLEWEKERVYSAIKELEFDHEIGKLSDEDFADLSRSYKMRAAAILQEEEEGPRVPADMAEADLEELIAGRRSELGDGKAGGGAPTDDDLERTIQGRRAEREEEV